MGLDYPRSRWRTLAQHRIHNFNQKTSLRPPSVKSKFWTPSAFKKSTNLSAKMAILFWLQFQLVSALCCFIMICMKAPRESASCAICNFWGLGTKYCESPYFRRLTTVVPSLLHHRHKMAGKSGKILVGDLKILSNADRDVTPAEANAI